MKMFVVLALLLLAAGAGAFSDVTVEPGNFYGEEIQKAIDYLRGIGLNASADNIQLYLNSGKIVIRDLPGAQLGGNSEKGGPVYIDPSLFPASQRSGGMDLSDPSHVDLAVTLAATLMHEKFHSENHDALDRLSGNINHGLGGTNPMEIEGWDRAIGFLDEVVSKLIEKLRRGGLTEDEERRTWQELFFVLNEKSARIDGYDENEFGPQFWNKSVIDELKKIPQGIVNNWPNATSENKTAGLDELKRGLDEFEEDAEDNLDEAEVIRIGREQRDEFVIDLVGMVAAVLDNPLESGAVIQFSIDKDPSYDLMRGSVLFVIDVRDPDAFIISDVEDVANEIDYYLEASQDAILEVFNSDDPSTTAQQLSQQGAIALSTEPLGRQFEETCGNAVLDRGEQCDYGYECPEPMVCSVICDCVYPRENATGFDKELPPLPEVQPENGDYYASQASQPREGEEPYSGQEGVGVQGVGVSSFISKIISAISNWINALIKIG